MVYLPLVLVAIAVSLFTIFSLLVTAAVSESLALVLFLIVAGLLIAGYMVGLMVLAFLAIVTISKRGGKPSKEHSMEQLTER
jgi:hypothetical protein